MFLLLATVYGVMQLPSIAFIQDPKEQVRQVGMATGEPLAQVRFVSWLAATIVTCGPQGCRKESKYGDLQSLLVVLVTPLNS